MSGSLEAFGAGVGTAWWEMVSALLCSPDGLGERQHRALAVKLGGEGLRDHSRESMFSGVMQPVGRYCQARVSVHVGYCVTTVLQLPRTEQVFLSVPMMKSSLCHFFVSHERTLSEQRREKIERR